MHDEDSKTYDDQDGSTIIDNYQKFLLVKYIRYYLIFLFVKKDQK